MKNFGSRPNIETFKHITVVYPPILESIKYMLQEHYDIPEYDDTIFMVNTATSYSYLDLSNCHQHRCIYYNFEHSCDFDIDDKRIFEDYIKRYQITEIWSFEPNCEVWDTDMGIKYMPPRYTTYIKKQEYPKTNKFDLGFVGVIGSANACPRRNDFLEKYLYDNKYDFSLKIMNGYNITELQDEFATCRFVLDTHRNYRHSMQNQVRIFEHICLGHTVFSEKSDYNIFPGLIYEWENIDELNDLIHTVEPQDFSEKYKEMTYTNEAYENYKNEMLWSNYFNKIYSYYNNFDIKRTDIINRLISKFGYKKYLEIGVFGGENYSNVVCEEKTSVDPEQYGFTKFVMTSDEYFNSITEYAKFDIIFIDGLHLWEQCYRDINNALNHLSPNGVIVCHDMNPLEEMYQSRNGNSGGGFWNGDVWKAFVKTRMERYDIHACMIEDCDFGLGIITFGNQEPLVLDKPFEDLTYTEDFAKNKAYLMNTVKVSDFLERNNL